LLLVREYAFGVALVAREYAFYYFEWIFDELVNLMELVVEIVKDGMSPSDLAAAQPF